MFEYKDNFLMGPAVLDIEDGSVSCVCSIRNEAAEELDELARLVGEGSTLEVVSDDDSVDESGLPAWTDVTEADAPRLEFDLEDELSRAFEKPPAVETPEPAEIKPAETVKPVVKSVHIETASASEPDFGAKALQDALAGSGDRAPSLPPADPEPAIVADPQPSFEEAASAVEESAVDVAEPPQLSEVPPIPVSKSETLSLDDIEPLKENGALSNMVLQEMDKALSELDGNSSDTAAAAASAGRSAENREDSLEDFSMELARLMGEPDLEAEVTASSEVSEAQTVPPTQGNVVMPWEAPEIVEPSPSAPPYDEVAQLHAEIGLSESSVFMSSLSPDSSLAAETTQKMPPAALLEVPSQPSEPGPIESVLEQVDAVETAVAQDAELSDAFDNDLEAALSRELDAELDPVADSDLNDGPTVIPPIYMPGAELAEKRHGGRRVAAGIVAVALLGGSAALAWNFVGSDNAEPPKIFASSDPVKVKPQDSGGKVVPNQDQSVYQAVDGKKDPEPKQTALKDESEQPIVVAKSPATSQEQAAVTPSDTTKDDTTPSTTTDTLATSGPIVPPRRVRTVVVRPDGTILTQQPANKTVAEPTSEPVLKSSVTPNRVAVRTVKAEPLQENSAASTDLTATKPDAETSTLDSQTSANTSTTAAVKPVETAVQPAGTELELKPVEPLAPTTETEVKKPEPQPVKIAKAEPPKPKPVARKQVETVGEDPLAPVKPAGTSAYSVQVSSQVSPEAARQSYQSLARRYAGIIGGKGVNFVKSKVKGRDYYRVRIPAASKQAAQSMCSRLKSSGGDCFVTR